MKIRFKISDFLLCLLWLLNFTLYSDELLIDYLEGSLEKKEGSKWIELFEDGVVVQTDQPSSNRRRWKTQFGPKPGKHFYFVKITQKDGNMMWSAPIWLTITDN